ncbi:hypothetical protein K432DRAFT_390233 [Lepidopterella palustris CBS 459.81]|uniref:Uncharacterized protein n=1 Tax=Lepidopterella palustris CBS 459.81 TaxID=1314670 RepID=A0A8E2EGM7_9PEZI|nr:hypothetical protein K432DRAFT_390233 [Lepidopterella palustris CBS 459.81]
MAQPNTNDIPTEPGGGRLTCLNLICTGLAFLVRLAFKSIKVVCSKRHFNANALRNQAGEISSKEEQFRRTRMTFNQINFSKKMASDEIQKGDVTHGSILA